MSETTMHGLTDANRTRDAMNFVTVNGTLLHYELAGDPRASTMVFSNSLGTDLRVWTPVLPFLPDGLCFLRYDKRGHGLSGMPEGPCTIEDHARDLAGLLDHLEIRQAIVCGLSVGGLIAQGLVALRPDLVRALILCGTAARIGTAESWNERMETIRQGGIAALADQILERWFTAAFRRERADELAGWRNMLVRSPLDGYLATCAAIRDADFQEADRRIAVPTQCICGTEDGSTPPALVRELAGLIPGAAFDLIEEAGHIACVEQPERFAAVVTRFVEENGLA